MTIYQLGFFFLNQWQHTMKASECRMLLGKVAAGNADGLALLGKRKQVTLTSFYVLNLIMRTTVTQLKGRRRNPIH